MKRDMVIELLREQLAASAAEKVAMSSAISRNNEVISELQKTISDLRETVKGQAATIAHLEDLLKERDASVTKAQGQLRSMNKLLSNKSEKVKTEAKPTTEAEKAAAMEEKAAARKERGNNGARRNMRFEMETIVKDIDPEDPSCDLSLATKIGERTCLRYEMVPPRFIKYEYHLRTYRQGDVIYAPKTPTSARQNSSFGGSFVAGLAELRYLYSMPVERITSYFNANGFDITKQTANGLLKKTAGVLEGLHKSMFRAVKEDNYLNCDETYHRILLNVERDGKSGSRKGYIWVIIAAHSNLAYFFYDDGSRSERVILDALSDYRGTIQSDGLGAYKKVAVESGGRIKRLACLQHCKRRFKDMEGNADADEVYNLANDLYRHDHEHRIGKDGWTKDDNLRWRIEYAPPILRKLKDKLEDILANTEKYPPRSQMHLAAQYFLNEWDGVVNIFQGGEYALDNNLIERVNRYISLSRHNSLFFGSHGGAENACIFYSLACTCKLLHINFFEYMSDLLERVSDLQPNASYEVWRELLPDRWKESKSDE